MPNENKSARLLTIYSELVSGNLLKKSDLAQRFHITERSVQRDIQALRCFFAEQGLQQDVFYDAKDNGYRLTRNVSSCLTNSEILAVGKILLESRSMVREEMFSILDKLLDCCVPANGRRVVQELLSNEKFLYIEPRHAKQILPGLWELGEAVRKNQVLEIEYRKMGQTESVTRTVEPVGLMFSEYYFYLIAYIRDGAKRKQFEEMGDLFPAIYRLDRILHFQQTGEHFHPVYTSRFQEGEFRKRVQFMYGGKLQKVKFTYCGPSIEAVLDRLPTAEILDEKDGMFTVQAEVFGTGIEMWLRSQGQYVIQD